MKQVLFALVFLSVAAAASAQTGVTITGVRVTVQNASGVAVGTPQTAVWPLSPGSCNLLLSPPPVGTVINPQFAEFDDPAIAGRACRANFGAYFATLAAASGYKFTLQYVYSDGISSGASNVSGPFDEVAAHPAPTGVGVR